MGLHQALDNEEPEPGATAPLGAPEPGEDPGRNLGRDTGPLVADSHRHTRSPSHDRRLHHSRYGTSPVTDRILDQVREDLVDLVGIEPGLWQLACYLDLVPVVGVASRHP